ncbi:hypothetical protein SLS57_000130 [Botryosphaeria dothidea]
MADSTSAASGAPPKQKRSFFKKPSWKQKVDNPDEDDPTAMFDGSKQTFSAVMEEQERARVKKLQEQEEKARRKELKAARQGKRRKIARDEEQYSDEDHVPATRVRYEATAQEHESVLTSATVIDLGDSDSDDGISPAVNGAVKQTSEPTPIDPDDDIDESDPELREIIRETRRKKRLEDERKAMQGTPPAGAGTQQGSSPGAARGVSTPLTPPPQDPPVQLLITSRIPNTKPLIVARKLRQRLQEVRIAWCKKQGFDREMTDSVFFTFKGRRLFDVATCRSLGLDADCFGNVYMKGNPNWDENDGRITVEAVTQEIYQENLREARRQREPEAERELELEPEPEPKKTKIIVKTKDFGDVKFTCSPETTFEKMARVSCGRLHLPADKRPYLLFDGERLEPNGTMAELDDFEDGDALEMHFE